MVFEWFRTNLQGCLRKQLIHDRLALSVSHSRLLFEMNTNLIKFLLPSKSIVSLVLSSIFASSARVNRESISFGISEYDSSIRLIKVSMDSFHTEYFGLHALKSASL